LSGPYRKLIASNVQTYGHIGFVGQTHTVWWTLVDTRPLFSVYILYTW